MAAGYETTAVTLAFTAWLLATNPEAERRLLEEIDRVGQDTVPTFENMTDWPYAMVRLPAGSCQNLPEPAGTCWNLLGPAGTALPSLHHSM